MTQKNGHYAVQVVQGQHYGTSRKLACDFLPNTNLHLISHVFRDMAVSGLQSLA